jgi:hypothetical protein
MIYTIHGFTAGVFTAIKNDEKYGSTKLHMCLNKVGRKEGSCVFERSFACKCGQMQSQPFICEHPTR